MDVKSWCCAGKDWLQGLDTLGFGRTPWDQVGTVAGTRLDYCLQRSSYTIEFADRELSLAANQKRSELASLEAKLDSLRDQDKTVRIDLEKLNADAMRIAFWMATSL